MRRHVSEWRVHVTDLQRRVLAEAEFLFYLATSPSMFAIPRDVEQYSWVSSVPSSELTRVNGLARDQLRGGSLAVRPPIPVRVLVDTKAPVRTPDGARYE